MKTERPSNGAKRNVTSGFLDPAWLVVLTEDAPVAPQMPHFRMFLAESHVMLSGFGVSVKENGTIWMSIQRMEIFLMYHF